MVYGVGINIVLSNLKKVMHPVIFQFGPVCIYSYGLMLAIAFFTSMFLLESQAIRQGISQVTIINLSFLVIVSGIIGARLLYVLLNLRYFLRVPLEIFMLHHGGLVLYGGLVLGTITGIVFLRRRHLPILKITDLIIPYVALGQAIGRIGCFLNGCCFGRSTLSWGIYFPAHRAILIPTQIYSSLAMLIVYIILRLLQRKDHRQGEIFILYFLFYSFKRFLIEFLRNDSSKLFLGLTIFQIISIPIFFISLFVLVRINKKRL